MSALFPKKTEGGNRHNEQPHQKSGQLNKNLIFGKLQVGTNGLKIVSTLVNTSNVITTA